MAVHKIDMYFSIFVGSLILVVVFSIRFLLLFYVVLNHVLLFLGISFCGWIFCFLNVCIFIFYIVDNILVIKWSFVVNGFYSVISH